MGRAKDEYMRMNDGEPTGDSEISVCGECVGDVDLEKFVVAKADRTECSYCGRKSETLIAIGQDALVTRMYQSIGQVYTDASNVLGYDSHEGGYQGTTYDGWDLMDEIGFAPNSDELYSDMQQTFSNITWCDRDAHVLNEAERKAGAWEKFKRTIKHQRRYTFWSVKSDAVEAFHPDYLPVGKLLAAIGNTIHNAGDRVVKRYPIGSAFWRARVQGNEPTFTQDTDLSPPPKAKATEANRMSPAGIVMFYGAEDFETACLEIVNKADEAGTITGAAFVSTRELLILNLFDVPKQPGFFNLGGADLRDDLSFLEGFATDIAKPVKNDKTQHIEYVPTQAFTEYIRYEQKL